MECVQFRESGGTEVDPKKTLESSSRPCPPHLRCQRSSFRHQLRPSTEDVGLNFTVLQTGPTLPRRYYGDTGRTRHDEFWEWLANLSDISAISQALLIVVEVKPMSCGGDLRSSGLGWVWRTPVVRLILVQPREKLARERLDESDQVRHSDRTGA